MFRLRGFEFEVKFVEFDKILFLVRPLIFKVHAIDNLSFGFQIVDNLKLSLEDELVIFDFHIADALVLLIEVNSEFTGKRKLSFA